MAGPHAIDAALDLARMPALATSVATPPLPPNVIEVMRIAAASPEACLEAEVRTGMPALVLMEAARFYLQQMLFHPEANAHRVLGLPPDASRELARHHMGWLMQWLHPDRNSGLDTVYTDRVLRAWREVSKSPDDPAFEVGLYEPRTPSPLPRRTPPRFVHIPWVPSPPLLHRAKRPGRSGNKLMRWMAIAAAIGSVALLLGLGAQALGQEETGITVTIHQR